MPADAASAYARDGQVLLAAIDSDMGTLGFASGTNDIGPLSDESMAPGDATFHGGWTVHRASPNTGRGGAR